MLSWGQGQIGQLRDSFGGQYCGQYFDKKKPQIEKWHARVERRRERRHGLFIINFISFFPLELYEPKLVRGIEKQEATV